MTKTILVPNMRFYGLFRYELNLFGLEFDKSLGRKVVVVDERIDRPPYELTTASFEFFVMRHVSPATSALNGPYNDPDTNITALVEPFFDKRGNANQSFMARGTDLPVLCNWFGYLMAGLENEYCTSPVKLAEQSLASQVLQAHLEAFQWVNNLLEQKNFEENTFEEIRDVLLRVRAVLSGQPQVGSTNNIDLEVIRAGFHEMVELIRQSRGAGYENATLQTLAQVLGVELN